MDKPRETLSGRPPESTEPGAPGPIDPKTGMHTDYWVLPPAERAKGYVRPLRNTYVHVGVKPPTNLRDLTAEEHERYDQYGYIKYEAYGPEHSPIVGRYWTKETLASLGKGCQASTTMHMAFAETYARDPNYYGSTFCAHCKEHFPVEEFVWAGTDERVGS